MDIGRQMDIKITFSSDTAQAAEITALEIKAGGFEFGRISYVINICFHLVFSSSSETKRMYGFEDTGFSLTITTVL